MAFARFFLVALLFSIMAGNILADDFFRETPLKPVYDALINDNPRLAYQELGRAVRKGGMEGLDAQWTKAGVEILEKSQCGRAMVSTDMGIAPIKVVLSVHSNPRRQYVYQVLIVAERTDEALSVHFKSANGESWFSGTLPRSNDPVTYESPEWFLPLPSGAYSLTVNNDVQYPIYVVPLNNKDWLDPWSDNGVVSLHLPRQLFGCPPVTVSQDWLDSDFESVAKTTYLRSDKDILLPTTYPKGAAWYGISASLYYFQGGLEVEMRQRVSIPVTWLPKRSDNSEVLKKVSEWPSRSGVNESQQTSTYCK